jgi:hypothetical protein
MSDRMTNAAFAKSNATFAAACEQAGIPATARQAGRWRRKEGLAYRVSAASRVAARAAAEAMTCAQLRSALGLKTSDRTRKAALVDLYLAR